MAVGENTAVVLVGKAQGDIFKGHVSAHHKTCGTDSQCRLAASRRAHRHILIYDIRADPRLFPDIDKRPPAEDIDRSAVRHIGHGILKTVVGVFPAAIA